MPLIIPEARPLQEKLEAAQQLASTVRQLLRVESGEPSREQEPLQTTGRGHRRKSAAAKPAPDDVTLKVIASQLHECVFSQTMSHHM